MLIDYKDLSYDALLGIAKEYVISQLSDVEIDIEINAWTQQVINRVISGELVVAYSELEESVSLKDVKDIILQD